MRLRVKQTLTVEDSTRSETEKRVESDSGTDSPGRHVEELDLTLHPSETRIPARSHKRVIARVDLKKRALYSFAVAYETLALLCMGNHCINFLKILLYKL